MKWIKSDDELKIGDFQVEDFIRYPLDIPAAARMTATIVKIEDGMLITDNGDYVFPEDAEKEPDTGFEEESPESSGRRRVY